MIAVLVLSYSSGILDLSTDRPLPGTESEVFQSQDQILVQSLREFGKFPLWNPYIHTGQPYVADPFLHVYNPLATIPVLIFGVLGGFKIALFLSFLAAALGMWWLATVMGMKPPARLWVALVYSFTGQIAARFVQGEYDFALGAAWIPWALGGLACTMRTRSKQFAALTAIFMALLFFSGNVYYSYYMLFAIAIFALVMLLDLRLRPIEFALDRERLKMLALVGALALGLIAIQLLPLVESWPYTSKESNPDLKDSHTFVQILRDYLSSDLQREDAVQILPPEEFYAYMGPGAFFALLLLPLARHRTRKRELLSFGLLLALVFLWIDVKRMPWADIYARTPLLVQFRYPTRMLIFGAAAILTLAGTGLDSLWARMLQLAAPGAQGANDRRWRFIGLAGVVLIPLFMIGSMLDVYSTNKRLINTWTRYEPPQQIMRWLADYDPGVYYVSNLLNWPRATIENEIRYIDAWYGYAFHSPKEHMLNKRPVIARPKYRILGNDITPEDLDARAVHRFEGHTIYELPNSLPFAWSATDEALRDASNDMELRHSDVTPLKPQVTGPNSLQVTARGDGDATLVVLTANYPGWMVRLDGQPTPLRNVGGYLASDLQPGEHEYVFAYRPTSFILGLGISLLSLAFTVGLIGRHSDIDIASLAQRLQRSIALPFPPKPGRRASPGPTYSPHHPPARSEVSPTSPAHHDRPALGEGVRLEGRGQIQIHASLEDNIQVRVSIHVERMD